MTATAILDRKTTSVGASAPPTAPSFGDDEYARQLERRLADERSAPRSAAAPHEATLPDAAIGHRGGAQPTLRSPVDPPAIGLQNNPFVAVASPSGEEDAAQEASSDPPQSQAPELTHSETTSTVDETPEPFVPSAPPAPWQQAEDASQKPASNFSHDLPLTAKAPTTPHEVPQNAAADGEPPQGLIRASELTTTRSRGIIAPPGLVVALHATQRGLHNTDGATGVAPADLSQTTLASADDATALTTIDSTITLPALDETGGALPVEQQTEADPIADGATEIVPSTANEANAAAAIVANVAERPAADKAVAVKGEAILTSSHREPHAAVNPIATSDAALGESTLDSAALAPSDSTAAPNESADDAFSNRDQSHRENEQRSTPTRRQRAADVVAQATQRAVEAVESSPAKPAAGGHAVAPTEAIPAALHASLVERVTEATDAPPSPTMDATATAGSESTHNGVRSEVKTIASASGQSVRGQDHSAVDLTDGLPRHAAAALRAAAGFDRPIRIRLSPAELGALQVEVGRHEGALHARFEVTTSAAQSMLQDHLPALRESLGRAGLTIDRIDVRLVETTQEDSRSDSQSHSNSGNEQGSYGGQDQERQRSEHRDEALRDADENGPARTATAVARPVDRSTSRTSGTPADLLDIQV